MGTVSRVPKHPIGSVENALRLLLLFGEHSSIRISEASEMLGVVRSTAHRLMAMLEYYGLVTQNAETKAYESGSALTALALALVGRMDSRAIVQPHLERALTTVNETAHFVVLDGAMSLFVAGVESTRPVHTVLRVGDRRPAHCTSGGKALLAELTPAQLDARMTGAAQLPALTPKSIVTLSGLATDLEAVRRRGYALSVGESEPEIAAIAVTMRDGQGQTIGAVSLSMPVSRFDVEHVETCASVLYEVRAALAAGR